MGRPCQLCVEWPGDTFYQLVASVQVLQQQLIDQMFTANAVATLFDPMNAGNADMNTLWVRHTILVPHKYVH